jgi:hypothetical protein
VTYHIDYEHGNGDDVFVEWRTWKSEDGSDLELVTLEGARTVARILAAHSPGCPLKLEYWRIVDSSGLWYSVPEIE